MAKNWVTFPVASPTAPAVTTAGMLWSDTSTEPPVLKIRNQGNTGWDTVGGSGSTPGLGAVLAVSSDASGNTITDMPTLRGTEDDGLLLAGDDGGNPGQIVLQQSGAAALILLLGLPTSDPHVANALYTVTGILHVSAG